MFDLWGISHLTLALPAENCRRGDKKEICFTLLLRTGEIREYIQKCFVSPLWNKTVEKLLVAQRSLVARRSTDGMPGEHRIDALSITRERASRLRKKFPQPATLFVISPRSGGED